VQQAVAVVEQRLQRMHARRGTLPEDARVRLALIIYCIQFLLWGREGSPGRQVDRQTGHAGVDRQVE
jgi:hypothetical protein